MTDPTVKVYVCSEVRSIGTHWPTRVAIVKAVKEFASSANTFCKEQAQLYITHNCGELYAITRGYQVQADNCKNNVEFTYEEWTLT